MSGNCLASWSMSTSRSWVEFRRVAGTEDTGASCGGRPGTAGRATSSCTRWSTTTRGWPTPRYCLTSKEVRAQAFCVGLPPFMSAHGIQIQRVMTDNHFSYRRSRDFRAVVSELGAKHVFIPLYSPQVNGKVERFNRTLLQEWAYVCAYDSNQERLALLPRWLHNYNFHRTHTALQGRPPIERVNDLYGVSCTQFR